MRYLRYFLLFTSVSFSQNYHYALDQAAATVEIPEKTTEIKNQLEEIEYFNAYLLPISEKANIQKALDTYGSVRLEKGDYTGVDIVMKSNQRLYGHPSLTAVSNITIAAGSKGVFLENLFPQDKTIKFEAGDIISNCIFKSIKWATLLSVGAKIENNSFINYGGHIEFNNSSSGYFRNNKTIRHQSGTVSNVLIMKGNTITPSYGNVNLWTNILTPHGDATDISNLQSATFVGIDAEGWNLTGDGSKAMFYARNVIDLKITDLGGANSYSKVPVPAFDIEADNLMFFNKQIQTHASSAKSKVSAKTNMIYIKGINDDYLRDGVSTGIDLKAHFNSNDVVINGSIQVSPIQTNAIKDILLGNSQFTPWAKPNWETLPNPLGDDWKINRNNKPDSREFIQNLINNDKIAELPEGIFYIGSTLLLPVDSKHGIIGKGTGKTVIVGLTDDFPLITLTGGQDQNFQLAYLTLQGGSKGIYSSQNYSTQHMAYLWMKYVVFRDQKYGIHLDKIMGFDNNFFDNISFVNCNIGFFQDPSSSDNNNIDTSSFVDKTMFYGGQFLNCDTGLSMKATRSDNLNAWVNCKFESNKLAIDIINNNFPIVANCVFTNNDGEYVISSNSISIYSSDFYDNRMSKSIIKSPVINIEGCNFMDNIDVFSSVKYNPVKTYVLNSVLKGNAFNLIIDDDYNSLQSGIFINSNLLANPTLSKTFVNIKENKETILIDGVPKPYPQFLVTQ